MKSKILLYLAVMLSAAFCAYGVSVEIPVTTNSLDTAAYIFSVTAKKTDADVSFHIVMTAKGDRIYPDSSISVDRVIHDVLPGGGAKGSVGPIKPEIGVAVKREPRIWTADFTLSQALLQDPQVCFVFTALAHSNIDGNSVTMPSADFYEIKLRDFVK